MRDDRTSTLNLPLPYVDNDLYDDVDRLRQALTLLDTFAGSGTIEAARKLATPRKINGVDFDGTTAITITAEANGGTASTTTGNAGSATKLQTARTINGVEFDGTANITITAAANGGTAATTTGNSGSATKLQTARKINGVDFDGTADITIADNTKLPSNGTAAAALKLATARTINGVAFDGTENITITSADNTKLPLAGGTITGTTESTSATTGALQVRGGVGVSKNLHVGGAITASGDVTAFSDERLKKDIQQITGALDKALKLRGVVFTDKATGRRRTGVIAQELQKVLPEAVVQNGDYLAVAYGNVIGLLIEAIRELASKVDGVSSSRRSRSRS